MTPRVRHQLPAFSPIPAAAIFDAATARVAHGRAEIEQASVLLRDYFTADDLLLVDSGRSALQLAIRTALAEYPGEGNHVALPAYSCFEVATAAVGAEARISLYDVDPLTLAPRLDSLEDALRAGARAVIVAPLYGMPVDWDAAASLAQQYDAVAIEDAAQSHGAQWRGARLGSLGALSVLSFGRGKGWTGGGGGALLARSPNGKSSIAGARVIAPVVGSRELKLVATALVQWLIGRPSVYGIPASIPSLGLGETHYHDPGPITGIAPFSAALLRRTLSSARHEVESRRAAANRWMTDLVAGARAAIPSVVRGGEAGYMRLPMLIPTDRGAPARNELARKVGMVASYPKTLAELPAVRQRLVSPERSYPGAERLSREVVTLPTHSRLDERDRATILEVLARVFS
ncbi:MAG TPA: DegT/DnrJ/EryC1/StrS family aminotransferase [Gemmatimonadaceae bacterium]